VFKTFVQPEATFTLHPKLTSENYWWTFCKDYLYALMGGVREREVFTGVL